MCGCVILMHVFQFTVVSGFRYYLNMSPCSQPPIRAPQIGTYWFRWFFIAATGGLIICVIRMASNISHKAGAFVEKDMKSIYQKLWRFSSNDSWIVPHNERDCTAFNSLELVLVYKALISKICDMSCTGNGLIEAQHKVKGWQGELPDSLVN